jgi:hypothetical protein
MLRSGARYQVTRNSHLMDESEAAAKDSVAALRLVEDEGQR